MEASDSNSWKQKIIRFWKQTLRVLRIIKRPNKQEYFMAMKVTGLGIVVIGMIGFILFMIKQFLF